MCNPHLTKTVDMRAYCHAINSGIVPTVTSMPLKPSAAASPKASLCFATSPTSQASPSPTTSSNKRSLSQVSGTGECSIEARSAADIPAVPRQPSDAPCTKLFNAFIQRAVPRFITANPRTRGMLVELIIRKVEEVYPDAFVEYCSSCNCGRSRVVPRDRIRAFAASKLIEASKSQLVQKQIKAEKRKLIAQKVQEANAALRKQDSEAAVALKQRVSQVQFKLPHEEFGHEDTHCNDAGSTQRMQTELKT
ncbi:hypothetical protein MPSEU_000075500 [Mayamaea pseudoterrestris]|nr:hypothetical protein MPSEU_000075500 [Mayamaea pseudoterrestris]